MDLLRLYFILGISMTGCFSLRSPNKPSSAEYREAYFNSTNSSTMRMWYTVTLHQHIGISFRTCVGGELFSQRNKGYLIQLSATSDNIVFTAKWPERPRIDVKLPLRSLDNKWHYVGLVYRAPELTLRDERHSVVVANSTFNAEILTTPELESEDGILQIGHMFSGCLMEGPGLVFNMSLLNARNVVFGHCPLSMYKCMDRRDVLTSPPVDHCYNEPCMRHGDCISRQDRYECRCTARYSGNNCQIDNGPPCESAPCQNGGRCEEMKNGDYKCTCATGYFGVNCEYEMHPLCSINPCLNNGTCRVPANTETYQCSCASGYTGVNCELNIDECQTAPQPPCQNGGICQDANNNYTCICTNTGYTGARCEINVNECELLPGPCLNQGVCYDTYGSYVCQCQPGYAGNNCQLNQNECLSSPCLNGGTCTDLVGSYECICPPGVGGVRCGQVQGLVRSRGARCVDFKDCPPLSQCDDGNHCVCQPPYTGVPGNCTLINGFECPTNPCKNGATCIYDKVYDIINCTCQPGYAGTYCELPNSKKTISNMALGNTVNSYTSLPTSSAPTVYSLSDVFMGGSAALCSRLPCKHASLCHQYPGGFYCKCDPGWTGVTCEVDIDECLSQPCLNGGECTQLINNFHCRCPFGYTGKLCQTIIDPCLSRPCKNGGECFARPNSTEFSCKCPIGFEGHICEKNIDDCVHVTCPEFQVCYDGVNSYMCRCPDGFTGDNCTQPTSYCLSSPCVNGTCREGGDTTDYTCDCQRGFTGRNCDQNINECQISGLCNQGICVDKPGGYDCYCKPGFTGEHCEVDFDECLSSPCKNNGTCLNKINNYQCICMPGFTGKDCATDINECESNPCSAGSTCIDGLATFTCVCMEGLTGPTCEVNIDDCASSPCLNGGVCEDGLNSYTCNCSDTGHTGLRCESNIDDCASNPCVNGAQCQDGVKDYVCLCHPGYTGKNCETDILECESSPCHNRGICLERSNVSLYQNMSYNRESPIFIDDEYNMSLPLHFYQEFSYANASGFECICIPGIKGTNCEININECESSPCGPWGTCVDHVGRYECECEDGFEGDHCQRDIDECARYKPCVRGRCQDRRANYYCDCDSGWGGKNCSVPLQGCATNKCKNEGTCRPWLQDEVHHRFNCTCSAGYHGDTCEMITTMSLGGHSYVVINTTREEGYDIQFRFKTTLGDGLLALGKGLTFYILELVNGRLNLHSSLLNKWEGVFIGSNLNDSNWQKVFVAINSSHLVLAANEEQTIYPINLNEGSNSSHTSFPTTYLGGVVSSLSRLAHGPAAFVGCVQDVIINNEWVLPQTDETVTDSPSNTGLVPVAISSGMASWLLYRVQATCPRVAQCGPRNPCHSGGRCTDLWTSFHCTCQRPYLGHTCQYNVTAATFGYENTTDSLVTVTVNDMARRAVRSIVDISMFIRTRKPTGQIFYLGSKPRINTSEETFVAASLVNGELIVRLQFNQTQEAYSVGGNNRLDNGFNHLIQVVRNSTLVQVKLNGSEYFRKSISATGQLEAQILYLGGVPLPVASTRAVRQADGVPVPMLGTTPSPALPPDHFKGIIQDVQISNGSRTMIVEFFPLLVPELEMPPAFGNISFVPNTILEGVVSDDSCADNPCKHNGTCKVTWNDFRCECPRGYKGKSCQEMEFCQLQDCPGGSVCRNLDAGYECLANATMNGLSPPLVYAMQPGDAQIVADSITIMYRSRTGGTLLHIENADGDMLSISVYKDQVVVEWRQLPETLPWVRRFRKHTPNFQWNQIHIHMGDKVIRGGFGDWMKEDSPAFIAEYNRQAWLDLLATGEFLLGGVTSPISSSTAPSSMYDSSLTTLTATGFSSNEARSLDDRRTFSMDRPMYRPTEHMSSSNNIDMSEFATESGLNEETTEVKDFWTGSEGNVGQNYKGCLGEVRLGNILLAYFPLEELYSEQNLYSRQSLGLVTPKPTLGCSLCFINDCINGGQCEDPINSYACSCQVGYSGERCEVNVDECIDANCANNSTCVDGVGNYTCQCQPGWEGWLCDIDINECYSSPCENGGTCHDMPGGFICECPEEVTGPRCSAPRLVTCQHQPCKRGSTCLSQKDEITGNNFTCKCMPGWEGVVCDVAYCIVKPCLNGGVCDSMSDVVPSCKCPPGFTGSYCETNIDDCRLPSGGSPCLHGGRCIDGIASFTCDCHDTGYEGVNCQSDIDECASAVSPCGDGGKCINTVGSFVCHCNPGLCGPTCLVIDPCYETHLVTVVSDETTVSDAESEGANGSNGSKTTSKWVRGPCQNEGICKEVCTDTPSYECQCVNGWVGKNCTEQLVATAIGDELPIGVIVGSVVGGLCALIGAGLVAACVLARTKRATRGTYSPSGQEYRNPRLEMLDNVLKPPPEERLI